MVLVVGVFGDIRRFANLGSGKIVGFLDGTILLFVLLLLTAGALFVVSIGGGQVGLRPVASVLFVPLVDLLFELFSFLSQDRSEVLCEHYRSVVAAGQHQTVLKLSYG